MLACVVEVSMPRYDQPEEEAELLTVQEAAKMLRIDQSTMYRYITKGLIGAINLPGVGKRVPRQAITNILNPQKQEEIDTSGTGL